MFWKRASVISSGVLAVLLVAALAGATVGSDESSSATSTTLVTTVTASAPAGGGPVVYEAAAAGTVEVIAEESGGLSVGKVDPADGWAYEIEVASGREVEVKFQGSQRIDFQAELEDGQVKTRVRNRALDVRNDGRTEHFTHAASGESTTFEADAAGTVEIRRTDSGLELIDAAAASGWEVSKTEITTEEIEVEFRNGATELEFKAELEDGMIRTRIETEVLDDSTNDDTADDGNRSGSDDDDADDRDVDDDSTGDDHSG